MPNLYALGERGVFADRHSAAFPSVTRVNSATISTGSYPTRHGLMHNTMLVAGMSDEAFGTGSARNLRRLAEFEGGRMLTAPSLGELLDEHDMRLFVTGSGGSGSSLLQNPVPGTGLGIWTAGGFFVPASARAEAVAAVGDLTDDNSGRTVWAFDAWLHKALSDDPPEAVIMWINEPDSAGHRHGVGAPATLEAVASIDAQIGRIVEAHAEHDLDDRVNIFVTSDHGFSTNAGRFSVARTLRENGFGADDLTVVGNMVFLARDDPALLASVIATFQRDSHAGNIYTRPAHPGSSEGIVPGTLSTAVIQWDHERAADVLVSPDWNDDVNEFGFVGTSKRGSRSPASHGSDSPYDLQIRLVAAGPDIKRGVRSQVPSGNVDLAPTILHLLGIEPPPGMSGRVLHELLREGEARGKIVVDEQTHRSAVTLADGLRYEAELDTLEVGSTVYLRGARTIRKKTLPP
jgi:arylsulfatase A-like enzyme